MVILFTHFFQGVFFLKFWPYIGLVSKSGFKSRVGYDGAHTVYLSKRQLKLQNLWNFDTKGVGISQKRQEKIVACPRHNAHTSGFAAIISPLLRPWGWGYFFSLRSAFASRLAVRPKTVRFATVTAALRLFLGTLVPKLCKTNIYVMFVILILKVNHLMFLEHWNRQKTLSSIRQRFSCLLDEWIEKIYKKKFSRSPFLKSILSILRCTWAGLKTNFNSKYWTKCRG